MKKDRPFKEIIFFSVILISVVLMTGTASAHRLHLDIEVQTFDVLEITVDAYYGDGKAVKNGEVTVQSESGEVLITGYTDSKGKFSFIINSTFGNETITIAVEQSGHKVTYDIEISGNLETVTLKGDDAGDNIPTYQGVISGVGYIVGIAGIASLIMAWRMKSQDTKKSKIKDNEPKINNEKGS